MVHEKENFNLLRPLHYHSYNRNDIPIITKDKFTKEELEQLNLIDFSHVKKGNDKSKSLVITFEYDSIIERMWNFPNKYIDDYKDYLAVATPDYSTYQNMNENIIRYNTFRNRWVGAYLQENGLRVIPTISWGNKSTYKYAFSGVSKHSVVIVSTIGCLKHKDDFLKGYNKMMKRIKPKVVIIYGEMFKGIWGNIINFTYKDAIKQKTISKKEIIKISKGGKNNGR